MYEEFPTKISNHGNLSLHNFRFWQHEVYRTNWQKRCTIDSTTVLAVEKGNQFNKVCNEYTVQNSKMTDNNSSVDDDEEGEDDVFCCRCCGCDGQQQHEQQDNNSCGNSNTSWCSSSSSNPGGGDDGGDSGGGGGGVGNNYEDDGNGNNNRRTTAEEQEEEKESGGDPNSIHRARVVVWVQASERVPKQHLWTRRIGGWFVLILLLSSFSAASSFRS